MSLSRLAPALGVASLAAASLLAPAASAGPCATVRIERAGATLPPDWSRAMNELEEATSVEGQAWSCSGGALRLSVDASGRFATLTLTDAGGRRVERRIPRAEDLVPSAKALLAAPLVEIEPAPAPAPAPAAPIVEMAPVEPPTPTSTAEPRVLVDVLLGARYRRPEEAFWGAGTVRATIPFGAWSGGLWLRGAIPGTLLDRDQHQSQPRVRPTFETTLGLSGGRRLINKAFQLHLTVDPSLTLVFLPSATPSEPGRRDELSVRAYPQLGLGLRGTFPLFRSIRGAVALEGDFLPKTVGGGLSLGIEAVIR